MMVGWPMRSSKLGQRRHGELGARPGQRLLLHLREVVEHRIAHPAFVRMGARPGAVLRELRPGRSVSVRARLRQPGFGRAAVHPDFFHQRARTRRRERAVDARDERRTAAPGKVHHVDGVAAVDEVVRPARPPVRRHQHLDAALPAAFADEHDRIGIDESPSAPRSRRTSSRACARRPARPPICRRRRSDLAARSCRWRRSAPT